MSMQLVNGILCLNCSDVERAKKVGLSGSTTAQDPLHPSTAVANGAPAKGAPTTNGTGADASGALTPDASQPLGINQPLAGGDRGTQLNLLA